jgi:protein TonB
MKPLTLLATLGASGTLHAALVLMPAGHAGPSQAGAGDVLVAIEATTEVTTTAPEPESPRLERAAAHEDHAPHWPTHTHPYPVAADHDWTPHDPNLVHPMLPVSVPAVAAPALTASDDAPTFSIRVSTGDDAHGAVSDHVHEDDHDHAAPSVSTEPLDEARVDGRARLVRSVAPSYPDSARSAGTEGDVGLVLVVGPSGVVESAQVVHGISRVLDDAAVRAVRAFRFAPATKGGQPVRVRMAWSVQFRLQ